MVGYWVGDFFPNLGFATPPLPVKPPLDPPSGGRWVRKVHRAGLAPAPWGRGVPSTGTRASAASATIPTGPRSRRRPRAP